MSTLVKFVRRLAAPLSLGLAALALPACGGGGYYSPRSGTLEVRNDSFSFEGIDAVEVSQPFGPIDRYDVFLAPGERDFIDLIPDYYDVDLLWSDGLVDSFYGVDVYDGATTVITGSN